MPSHFLSFLSFIHSFLLACFLFPQLFHVFPHLLSDKTNEQYSSCQITENIALEIAEVIWRSRPSSPMGGQPGWLVPIHLLGDCPVLYSTNGLYQRSQRGRRSVAVYNHLSDLRILSGQSRCCFWYMSFCFFYVSLSV